MRVQCYCFGVESSDFSSDVFDEVVEESGGEDEVIVYEKEEEEAELNHFHLEECKNVI